MLQVKHPEESPMQLLQNRLVASAKYPDEQAKQLVELQSVHCGS
jgi:hypothetical protein